MKSKKEYRFKQNPEEERFFKTFIDDGRDVDMRISFIVHGASNNGGIHPNKLATEDEINAFLSAIQWLGSPVGQSFLKYEMGYKKEE